MVRRSYKLTILWVSMDVGKGVNSKLVGGSMGLLVTLVFLRLIWLMHPMYYSVS